MKLLRILAPVLAITLSYPIFAADAPKPAEPAKPADAAKAMESLDTAIPYGIKLLETGEFKQFIESFASPDDIKKMNEGPGVAEVAKRFGTGQSAVLIKVLNGIKGTKPTMSEDGKTATYPLPAGVVEFKKDITFVRIGAQWYIKD